MLYPRTWPELDQKVYNPGSALIHKQITLCRGINAKVDATNPERNAYLLTPVKAQHATLGKTPPTFRGDTNRYRTRDVDCLRISELTGMWFSPGKYSLRFQFEPPSN
ncbi:hypothetical protein PoB_003080700 [Plakobranchus ocellatus]|uniref:Uncharacterized protein n=1 Tax=Plakobranchus ocellatus TaxID=259542 RepID=A0AAV4ABP5_9GAST|nr:hypothetical protein PoB_003080700 [Plakobranchus ocellatus]